MNVEIAEPEALTTFLMVFPAKPSAGALHRRVEAVLVADWRALVHPHAPVLHSALVVGELLQARSLPSHASRGKVRVAA